MAKLNASRTAQWPLVAEFTFNFDDTMVDTTGALKDFKTVATTAFDVIALPAGSVVIGGDVVTETAIGTSTAYNIKVGDATTDDRYLGTTDRVAAGRTALVPTGFVSTGEALRVSVTPTVAAATAGKVTVRVLYTMRGRSNEVAIIN